jgi:hypothetical protein
VISGRYSWLHSSPRMIHLILHKIRSAYMANSLISKVIAQVLLKLWCLWPRTVLTDMQSRGCAMKRFVFAVILVSVFMSSQLWAGNTTFHGSSRSGHSSTQYTGRTTYTPHSSVTTTRENRYKNGRYLGTTNTRIESQRHGNTVRTTVRSSSSR